MSTEDEKHQAYLQSLRGALLPQLQASIAGASSLTSERYRKTQEHENAVLARREREAAEEKTKADFEAEKVSLANKLAKQKEKNKKKKKGKVGSKRTRDDDASDDSSVY
jgi:hypothetical protein